MWQHIGIAIVSITLAVCQSVSSRNPDEKSCDIYTNYTWRFNGSECGMVMQCLARTTYKIEQQFLCEDNTTIRWEYPQSDTTLNFKMWFEGKSDEYRMCLQERAYWEEKKFSVIDRGPTPDDENGPIIATHGSNLTDQDSRNFTPPCVRSKGGIVKFRITSITWGYGMIIPLTVFHTGLPAEEPSTACNARTSSYKECEIMITDCPAEGFGTAQFEMLTECKETSIAWYYSWSDYLDFNTWLPGKDRDFILCLHGATQPGNVTYTNPDGTETIVTEPLSMSQNDDYPIRIGSCFASRNGIAKFKLAPSSTYYVVWFKASYYVRDRNASGKLQVGILAIVLQFVVFTSFMIVFNDNKYT